MKAILVVDVEEHGEYYADVYRKDADDRFEGRYYLKPLPPKLDENDWHRMFNGLFSEREAYGHGWNACLDEIVGETE